MRSSSRILGLAAASLLVAGCLTLDQCIQSRNAAVAERLADAASGQFTGPSGPFRLALCGFTLERTHKLRVDGSPQTTFSGDKNSGTGETNATLVSTSKDAEEGFRCQGKVAFAYRYHPSGKHPSYYEFTNIHRVGDAAPIVAIAEKHATTLDLDAPTGAFADGWKLPDGRIGAAYRVEIEKSGGYTVRFGTTFPAFEGPVITVIQDHQAVGEGDDRGGLGFWKLDAGEAVFLLSHVAREKVEITVTSNREKTD